jgi:predicted acyl esterase
LRRSVISVVATCLLASLMISTGPSPALGASKPLKCKTETLQGKKFRFCRGLVKSADKTVVLDTDVTLPARGDGPFPVIVMLHGLGGSKTSYEVRFESDPQHDPARDTIEGVGGSYRYNNVWFASRGYAVINYTARGWHEDECLDDTVMSSDARPDYPDSPACMIQLNHKDYEIKDTQYLVGRLVDKTLLSADVSVNRKRVGATGVSYGGGHTWMLTRDSRWTSPKGAPIKLRVAAPLIGWTDMLDALAPNGTTHADMVPPTDVAERAAERPGVVKQSYINRFWTGLNIYSATQGDLPDYLNAWRDRALDGEPYDDETYMHLVESMLNNRSAFYMEQEAAVPTVSVQGWTDHIFPAVQSLGMVNRLWAENPEHPLKVLLNDFGHPIAQNPAEVIAYGSNLINTWLDFYLRGKGQKPSSGVESFETVCTEMGEQETSNYVAGSFEELQNGTQDFDMSLLTGTLDSSVNDPHASALDPFPVAPATGCRDTDTAVAQGNLAATMALPEGLDMLGMPTVSFEADPELADMYVAFRLWDVSGDTQVLVDRGVVRLGSDETQTVIARLQGNNYEFQPGHSLKLEFTADDSPSFRSSNGQGAIEISDVMFEVPLANSGARAQG